MPKSALRSLGKYSFRIYLVHIGFTTVIIALVGYAGITTDDWLFYPLVFSTTVASSWVAVRLMSGLEYSEYLIGTLRAPVAAKPVRRVARRPKGPPSKTRGREAAWAASSDRVAQHCHDVLPGDDQLAQRP